MRVPYDTQAYQFVDYTNTIGTVELHPISGRLLEIPNFLTLANPFDKYIWISIITTAPALICTLIFIEKFYFENMRIPSKDILQRCIRRFFSN